MASIANTVALVDHKLLFVVYLGWHLLNLVALLRTGGAKVGLIRQGRPDARILGVVYAKGLPFVWVVSSYNHMRQIFFLLFSLNACGALGLIFWQCIYPWLDKLALVLSDFMCPQLITLCLLSNILKSLLDREDTPSHTVTSTALRDDNNTGNSRGDLVMLIVVDASPPDSESRRNQCWVPRTE